MKFISTANQQEEECCSVFSAKIIARRESNHQLSIDSLELWINFEYLQQDNLGRQWTINKLKTLVDEDEVVR